MDFYWDDDVREIFDNSTYAIRESEVISHGLSWDDLRDSFDRGWVTDQDLAAREEFFDYLAELGYSEDDFDWDAWRDWYEE